MSSFVNETIKRRDPLKTGMQGAAVTALSPFVSSTSPLQIPNLTSKLSNNWKVIVAGAGALAAGLLEGIISGEQKVNETFSLKRLL